MWGMQAAAFNTLSASSGFYVKNVKNISAINLCQVKSDVSNAASATQG